MDGPGLGAIFLFEGFRFDRSAGDLRRKNGSGEAEPLKLGSRASSLLALLMERQGEVVTKDEIFAAVWPGTAVEEANLTVQISALRRILDQDRKWSSCIQTVPGRGYRFGIPVTRAQTSEAMGVELPVAISTASPLVGNGSGEGFNGAEQAVQEIRNGRPRHRFGRAGMAAVAVALCLVAGGAAALNWHSLWLRHTQTAPRLSIVVLPFANLTNDSGQQYFVDTITAGLTTDLSRIWDMFVISRDSALAYKDKPADARQIGRELGVRYVVGGGVGRSGDQAEVNYQLADAESGSDLWADRFETHQVSGEELQDEITGCLVRTLHLKLLQLERRRIERERPEDLDARDLVIRGWAELNREHGDPSELQQLFERALEINPQLVTARLGIARLMIRKMTYPPTGVSLESEARAERLLDEAVKLHGNQPETHSTIGLLRLAQNRLTEAKVELETAVALDRNNSLSYFRLGLTLMYLGRPEAGISEFAKAMRLNPAHPNVARYYWGLGACHLLLGHTDEAVELFRKARAVNPQLYSPHLWLAGALGLRGDLDEAKADLTEASKMKPEVITYREIRGSSNNREFLALLQNTMGLGLRRAGLPD
jgi:TolB-like protein/DNA-binding winged helix-turn-helix (wHTH) protein/tetratricopeptide (TPR) repeat protein